MSSWWERVRSVSTAGLQEGRLAICVLLVSSLPAAAATVSQSADEDDEESVPVMSGAKGTGSTNIPTSPANPTKRLTAGDGNEGVSWAFPPMPWRAQLTLSSGATLKTDGGNGHFFSKGLSAQASSYVWQPWFARLNGSASFIQSDTYEAGTMGRGQGVTVDLSMDLLPSSRFPVFMSGGQTESSAKSPGASSGMTSRRFSMNQRYTPPTLDYSSGWGYSWSEVASDAGGRSSVQNLNANLGLPLPGANPQSLAATAVWSGFRNNTGGASSDYGSLTANHTIYLEDYVLSIGNDALLSLNSVHSPTSSAESRVAQAGSNFDWVPDDDSPLRLNGSMRAFNTTASTDRNGALYTNQVSTLNGTLGASYPLNRQWSFGANINSLGTWQQDSTQGAAQKSATVSSSINASWRGDGWRTKFDEWSYSLGYGSSSSLNTIYARNPNSTISDSHLGVSSSVNQSFSRGFQIQGYRAPVQLSLSQGYSASKASGSDLSHSLSHGLASSWQLDSSSNTQTTVNASATDSRNFGEQTTAYQQLQSSVQGNTVLSGYSSVNSIFSMQFNRQHTAGENSGGGEWQGSAAGSVGYNRSRFADVTGLEYTARYGISIRPSAAAASGQSSPKTFELDHQVSQGWGWRLGLLGWRIENTFSYDAAGRIAASVFLSVNRDFSGVL
jgi:hypothetical protein